MVDALFTSTSAVCVTGLITVDTASYSFFGKLVIMLLIQFGGLGIITFTTLYLANPRHKISLIKRKLIGEYYLDTVLRNPLTIIRHIILFTMTIELLGALSMFFIFRKTVGEGAFFCSLFHSISAFCNAGFSLFNNNFEDYLTNPTINATVMALIVCGGLGFVVLEDLVERLVGKRRTLTLHTRLVLLITAGLIMSGVVAFLLFDWNGALEALTVPQKVMASLFQSITPRTAGFDTIPQRSFSAPSQFTCLFLMYVGASSASTGGGIKTTTFFLILLMILRGTESQDIRLFGRKIPSSSIARAMIVSLRAFALLALCIAVLTVSELLLAPGEGKDFLAVVFESFSAFGTVGLSLGLTPTLTVAGKLMIIFTMFAGRVGMIALAISTPKKPPKQVYDVPREEVLIG